ncbi:MAG: hypothetical protein NMNS02_30690 [Nitrosomonas sp.]|nr:hypothetical protein [Nitrosomonas sp.]GJL76963.1 MAG: hypothetical protein NMNS02_30690 [Nitrosomonas sp.]
MLRSTNGEKITKTGESQCQEITVNWKIGRQKISADIIETAGLNSVQLSEYCRSKGLYPEQIDQWKTAALSGYQHNAQVEEEKIRSRREDRKQMKRLESELRRKEKAGSSVNKESCLPLALARLSVF